MIRLRWFIWSARKSRRTNRVDQAITYIDKELATYRGWGDPDPGFALLRAGVALEAAGEISAQQRCTYYHRAVEVLQEAAAASEGDRVILRGRANTACAAANRNIKSSVENQK